MVFATKWHLMTYFLMCTQGGHPSHRDAGPLTGWLGLSQEGRASYREAGPLTVRSGRSEGGRASYREAGPLTGRPGLSQAGVPPEFLDLPHLPETHFYPIFRHTKKHFYPVLASFSSRKP